MNDIDINAEVTPGEPGNDALLTPVATVLPALPQVVNEVKNVTQGKCSVTVTRCKVRGAEMWRVRFWEDGKVRRVFKNTKTEADALAVAKTGEGITNRKKILLLPPTEADGLMMIYNEAQRRGIALTRVLTLMAGDISGPLVSPATDVVVTEYLKFMEAEGLDITYIGTVRQTWNNFMAGREKLAFDQWTVADVRMFLHKYSIKYRPSLRSRLSGGFNFGVTHSPAQYRKNNPCAELGRNKQADDEDIEFMSPGEVKRALEWLLVNPRLLGWFVLSCLFGLRPDEARLTEWTQIKFELELVIVHGQTSKKGQRRPVQFVRIDEQSRKIADPKVVRAQTMVFEWLKVAQDKCADLPVSRMTYRRELRKLCIHMGWQKADKKGVMRPHWKKDVTRHTAATMWLALIGSTERVSIALGNTEEILRKHYVGHVMPKAVEEFWALTPAALGVK